MSDPDNASSCDDTRRMREDAIEAFNWRPYRIARTGRCHVAFRTSSYTLLLVAAALAGCVSASKVTPTMNGTYVIQGKAVGIWNADKERAKALKKANEYCANQGKRMLLHDMDETGHAALLGERVTITFECET
jgi:hypothetical protein